jgi:hypothetical protein
MRHLLRFCYIVILLALTTSANAQECSTADQPTKSWNQQPPDPLCGTGPAGNHPFTVVSSTVDTCTNKNTGVVYDQSVRQVTGNGIWQCAPPPLTSKKCNPTITQEVTHATSSTDYNRFYLRAWDADPSQSCGVFANISRQDFWQCLGIRCNTAPPCSVCPWTGRPGVCVCPGTPLVIDTTGNGYHLTSLSDGVKFDLDGNGTATQMSWTQRGSDNAFLALPGADGLVHDGKQLFGNFTPQPPSDHPNGFAALAVYDEPKNGGNGDGIIDSRDGVFASLRLWIDTNHDGICQADELFVLPDRGVNSISLKYREDDRTDQYGNKFRYRAHLNPDKPTDAGKTIYDIFFLMADQPISNNLSCPVPADPKIALGKAR